MTMHARLQTRNIRQRIGYARYAAMPARRMGDNPRDFVFYVRQTSRRVRSSD
jgi:hypothetical protein